MNKTLKQYLSFRILLAKIEDKKQKAIFKEVMSYIIAAKDGSYIEGTKWRKNSSKNRFTLKGNFMSFEYVAWRIAYGIDRPIKLTRTTQTTKSL